MAKYINIQIRIVGGIALLAISLLAINRSLRLPEVAVDFIIAILICSTIWIHWLHGRSGKKYPVGVAITLAAAVILVAMFAFVSNSKCITDCSLSLGYHKNKKYGRYPGTLGKRIVVQIKPDLKI